MSATREASLEVELVNVRADSDLYRRRANAAEAECLRMVQSLGRLIDSASQSGFPYVGLSYLRAVLTTPSPLPTDLA